MSKHNDCSSQCVIYHNYQGIMHNHAMLSIYEYSTICKWYAYICKNLRKQERYAQTMTCMIWHAHIMLRQGQDHSIMSMSM